MSDLSIKATRGMLWSLAESFGLQAVQLLISIILARLLLPGQFGLIGMLTLFMALAQSLLDSGFGSALIQKKDQNQLDACSVFYFNLIVGVVLMSFLYAAAPLIAKFYREPLLIPLTRLLSLSIIINAFGLVPFALLTKRLQFKALFKVSMVSVIISGGAGVGLAVKGFGVWSLAVQSVLGTFLRTIMLWQASNWRPERIFSRVSLATMFSFGSRMMMSGLLETFFLNIYLPLIGKLHSAADLGYYVRAQTLQSAAIQPAGSVLGRVMFPALSPIQDDQTRLKQAVQKTLTTAMFFHIPLMVGLIVTAESLITLLFTNRWAPSIPYFQLFCLVGLFYPLNVINAIILPVMGRSDLFLRLEVIKKLMIVTAIAITYRWGIIALLCGQVATSTVTYFVNSYYTGRLIGYSAARQLLDIYPLLFMSLLMGAGMYLVGISITPALPKLLAQSLTGVCVYVTLNYLWDRSVMTEFVRLAKLALQPTAS